MTGGLLQRPLADTVGLQLSLVVLAQTTPALFRMPSIQRLVASLLTRSASRGLKSRVQPEVRYTSRLIGAR